MIPILFCTIKPDLYTRRPFNVCNCQLTRNFPVMPRRQPRQPKSRLRAKFPTCLPPSPAPSSPKTTKNTAAPTWENIVLYYLSKLRGFLRPAHQACTAAACNKNHPVPGRRETSAESFRRANADPRRSSLKATAKPMEPEPDRYSSKCQELLKKPRSTSSFRSASEADSTNSLHSARQKKAIKIVSAAVDYGCATGIIGNNGKYFWFKEDAKAAGRSPTPAPRKLCRECSNVKALSRKRYRSVSVSATSSVESCRSEDRDRKRPTGKRFKLYKTKHPRVLTKKVNRTPSPKKNYTSKGIKRRRRN